MLADINVDGIENTTTTTAAAKGSVEILAIVTPLAGRYAELTLANH